jgi:hypothetical protein
MSPQNSTLGLMGGDLKVLLIEQDKDLGFIAQRIMPTLVIM